MMTSPSVPKTFAYQFPIGLCVCLLLLWNFYIQGAGIRPFDLAAFSLIILWQSWQTFCAGRLYALSLKRAGLLTTILLLSFVFAALGMLKSADNVKAGIGFVMGAVVLLFFYTVRITTKFTLAVIKFCLIVNVGFLLIQWAVYHSTGQLFNPHAAFGGIPRGAAGPFFRPSGLFLEPAAYSLSMLMLLVLRARLQAKFDWVTYVTIGSMLLSFSVWGLTSSVIYLLYHRLWSMRFVLAVAALMFIVGVSLDLRQHKDMAMFARRLDHITTDGSARLRYGGLASIREETALSPALWFGEGVSNYTYAELGGNSLAYLIRAGGFLGGALFLFTLLALAQPGTRIQVTVFLLLCLTAASLWTYFYWWAWLGLLLKRYEDICKQTIKPDVAQREVCQDFVLARS